MKKRFIILSILFVINSLFIVLFIITRIFYSNPCLDAIYNYMILWLEFIFYRISIFVYGGIFVAFVVLLFLFILGYNIAKTRQLTGSIMYVSSFLGFVVIILIGLLYAYMGILFNQDLTLTTRLMLFFLFLPLVFGFGLVLFLVNIDFYIFLKDLIHAKKIWKYKRPEFKIEIKGKITFINIETDEHIFTPIPMLIIAQHLRSKGFSISWFVKGAFTHLLSLIITYLIGWPHARNVIFRFMGMKIGRNCHISSRSIPDPLLPELIEFENGSGCGIGVQLLTHNVMNIKHACFSFGPIRICENARIGAFSIILPGVTIGRGSIIGAGSVVSNDIPPYSIAYGSPAKVVREFTESEKIETNKKY